VRISATDAVVDLMRGDFDIAIRYGTGRYAGLSVELLLKNEVLPVCNPELLCSGPPIDTLEDLRHHALLHDQTIADSPAIPRLPSCWWRSPTHPLRGWILRCPHPTHCKVRRRAFNVQLAEALSFLDLIHDIFLVGLAAGPGNSTRSHAAFCGHEAAR
jgi:DNA-binding transcriptional LysR family regulator